MCSGPKAAGSVGIWGPERRTLWPGLQERWEEARGALRAEMRILNFIQSCSACCVDRGP